MLAVIMWAGGIGLAFVGSTYAVISTRFSKVDDNIINHERRISSTEAKIDRIPEIEKKIDMLLLELNKEKSIIKK